MPRLQFQGQGLLPSLPPSSGLEVPEVLANHFFGLPHVDVTHDVEVGVVWTVVGAVESLDVFQSPGADKL